MNNIDKAENKEKEEIMGCKPVPRNDGMTNTISTVQKDNLLIERVIPIDLTLNEPRAIDRANCIKARYDAGISNFKQDGTGVVEQTSD